MLRTGRHKHNMRGPRGRISDDAALGALETMLRGRGGQDAQCTTNTTNSSHRFNESLITLKGKPATHIKGNALALATTLFVTSSPRPHDDRMQHAQQIADALISSRRVLKLAPSSAYVVFDGLRGKPSITASMVERYGVKVRNARKLLPATAHVLYMRSWLHMANSLRCAMSFAATTPLVFVIQDDTQAQRPTPVKLMQPLTTSYACITPLIQMVGPVDTAALSRLLLPQLPPLLQGPPLRAAELPVEYRPSSSGAQLLDPSHSRAASKVSSDAFSCSKLSIIDGQARSPCWHQTPRPM